MTPSQIMARILIYGSAWVVTALALIGVFDWSQPKRHADSVWAARFIAYLIWAVIICVIYW